MIHSSELWDSYIRGGQIPESRTLEAPLYLVFRWHLLHYTCVKFISLLKEEKSWPLWSVMMDNTAKTHERKKMTKMCSNYKWIVAVEVCGKTYCKIDKDGAEMQS